MLLSPLVHLPDAPVVALDLDSRQMPVEAAVRAHRQWLSNPAVAELPLYKKIDSTLRGHYAAEIAALNQRAMAVMAPAYPALMAFSTSMACPSTAAKPGETKACKALRIFAPRCRRKDCAALCSAENTSLRQAN